MVEVLRPASPVLVYKRSSNWVWCAARLITVQHGWFDMWLAFLYLCVVSMCTQETSVAAWLPYFHIIVITPGTNSYIAKHLVSDIKECAHEVNQMARPVSLASYSAHGFFQLRFSFCRAKNAYLCRSCNPLHNCTTCILAEHSWALIIFTITGICLSNWDYCTSNNMQ